MDSPGGLLYYFVRQQMSVGRQMSIALILRWMYNNYMNEKKSVQHRKDIRKDVRLTVRLTEPLFNALEDRAYEESKTVSAVIIEAVRKFLDFKMPPRE
jgi:hypothetical protein